MSKPLFDDPKKPLVLYIKNGDTFAELKNTFGSNVAICGQCGTIYSTQNSDSSTSRDIRLYVKILSKYIEDLEMRLGVK